MQFYTVEDLVKNQEVGASGIDMLTMSKVFKLLEKKSEFKTLNDVMNLNVIVLEEPYKLVNAEDVSFSHESKNLNFAIVKDLTEFQLTDGKNHFYCALHESKLKSNLNRLALQDTIQQKSVNSVDPIEAKAIHWLDNGRVGASSATMCGVLFPSLREHHQFRGMVDYDDNFEINYPHDVSDFGRCMKFLEAVPEAKERLGELKSLNSKWENLVENWTTIEDLINKGDTSSSQIAYDTIQKCIEEPKKPRP